ncbi:MAG TPA: enoyl-CoA hydratase/isomerase family protein [Sporichthya sp.]|nr:enoyl-CoA hydratase/isomerase family protein [Sporichthya sp.]
MIERDDVDRIAVVRLSHGKVNALDLDLVTAIRDTFLELETSEHQAVVFTGTGRSYCAGVDLTRIAAGDSGYARDFLKVLSESFAAVFNLGKPVVAAVNGHAIAGGCVFVNACDRRLMAEGTGRIGVTELLAGVPFPTTALEIMRFAVGPARTPDLVFTGRTCLPAEALEVGLVDEVVPADELTERAVALARRLATEIPSATFQLTKRQLHQDANDRIARLRTVDDPQALAIWESAETRQWIGDFMKRVTASK